MRACADWPPCSPPTWSATAASCARTRPARADQEYFADGITEDLITALSYWRWFPVISRNSTFAYKRKARDATAIGRELGARYLVEGSVRKAGGRVRISAQLVDAEGGHHLWAQRYDRELADIFALQDEITREIVGSIEPELARAEQARVLRKPPGNLDAWDLAVRALRLIRRASRKDLSDAHGLLETAGRLDPASSQVRSLMALARFTEALYGWQLDPAGALASMLATAAEAVALDERDWLAHALHGIGLLWNRRDFARAIAEEGRALELNPSAAISYQFLGCALEFAGRPAEAIPILQAVLKLEPRYQSAFGWKG